METMLIELKREPKVSKKIKFGPRGVGLYARRAEENRRLAIDEWLEGKRTHYINALLAQGYYTSAANKYKEAASKEADTANREHLLRKSAEAHRKSGIMWFRLQRTWEGAEELRKSGMPEAYISRLAHRYIFGIPIML
jgi:hypothetical protein